MDSLLQNPELPEILLESKGQSLIADLDLIWCDAEEVVEPYRKLLVHDRDMTSALERFHEDAITLEILQARHSEGGYFREVVLRTADIADHSLIRLGPGETFGELAILRSAPISADVVAVSPLTLLRYPGEFLPSALAECEPLRRSLLTRMAHNVHRTTTEALGLYKQTRALGRNSPG